ncbi:MAG TPA: ATP-binding protein [Acidimicrobiales bacterium]|nr:ATP-binding protein [Acidimicrobiales bacterium]
MGILDSELLDHLHGPLLQLRRVPLCGALLFHGSILASKVWSLRGSQGGSPQLLRKLVGVDLLIIDDFALHLLDVTETNDFKELAVQRHRKEATVLTSNRDPSEFLAQLADPLLAQSAVDRLQSAAYELVIEGES